jgi:hypothetical protein
VVVLAGPEQAATRNRKNMWNWSLPALIFPEDRSWLVSLLWDDDWVSVGGSAELITKLRQHPNLARATHPRSVEDPDAAPPVASLSSRRPVPLTNAHRDSRDSRDGRGRESAPTAANQKSWGHGVLFRSSSSARCRGQCAGAPSR